MILIWVPTLDPEKAQDPTDPDYKKAARTNTVLRDDPDEEARVLKSGNK